MNTDSNSIMNDIRNLLKKVKLINAGNENDKIENIIYDLVDTKGLVSIGLEDVYSLLTGVNTAYISIGEGMGENASEAAAHDVINKLSNVIDTHNINAMIMKAVGSVNNINLVDFSNASEIISDAINENADIVWGITEDETLEDKVYITIIAVAE